MVNLCILPDYYEMNSCQYQSVCIYLTIYIYGTCVAEIFDPINEKAKPPLKIRTAKAIFWIYLGGTYGLKNNFFRNKTFLFFKIGSWNFQHLFEIKFRETSQHFNSLSLFKNRFHKIQFQKDAESFSILSWKTKKFYS
jgi:predicted nucleic acid-binding Zn finger protein